MELEVMYIYLYISVSWEKEVTHIVEVRDR